MNHIKKKWLILGIIAIILIAFIVFFSYLQLTNESEKDKFLGEWADPDLTCDNWAFFPDRSFAVQVSGIWKSDGSYDIKADQLIITMPNNEGIETYFFSFSKNNQVLTLYLKDPPSTVYRVYNKVLN